MKNEIFTKSRRTIERLQSDERYELAVEIYDERELLTGALFQLKGKV
ncbi:hypothetical protein [Halobacillus seohaensis]|uniref:Uncharacterized protein n=1 Tax=Halobacillus seohaensis TaxID=447421 RepID=A0ABW2EU81_9BACI